MTDVVQIPSTMSTNSSSGLSRAAIPADKVRLDVLLISGQRQSYLFDPETTVKSVREEIWKEWPQSWPEKPSTASSMRILHMGHILDDKTILYGGGKGSTKNKAGAPSTPTSEMIPGAMIPGKSSVIHLLIRQETIRTEKDESAPKNGAKKMIADDDEATSSAGCCNCIIC